MSCETSLCCGRYGQAGPEKDSSSTWGSNRSVTARFFQTYVSRDVKLTKRLFTVRGASFFVPGWRTRRLIAVGHMTSTIFGRGFGGSGGSNGPETTRSRLYENIKRDHIRSDPPDPPNPRAKKIVGLTRALSGDRSPRDFKSVVIHLSAAKNAWYMNRKDHVPDFPSRIAVRLLAIWRARFSASDPHDVVSPAAITAPERRS